jgi:hypothetical protein
MMKLACASGEVEAGVGDRFRNSHGDWEIAGFRPEPDGDVICTFRSGDLRAPRETPAASLSGEPA